MVSSGAAIWQKIIDRFLSGIALDFLISDVDTVSDGAKIIFYYQVSYPYGLAKIMSI